jgi:hypothetical protein
LIYYGTDKFPDLAAQKRPAGSVAPIGKQGFGTPVFHKVRGKNRVHNGQKKKPIETEKWNSCFYRKIFHLGKKKQSPLWLKKKAIEIGK